MIIKFKSKETWVMFGEVDHVEYSDLIEDISKTAFSSDVILYHPANDQAAIGKWVQMSFFTKNMSEATRVVACTPIYLMNDQGQTVETI